MPMIKESFSYNYSKPNIYEHIEKYKPKIKKHEPLKNTIRKIEIATSFINQI
jgi:hypothetical protein